MRFKKSIVASLLIIFVFLQISCVKLYKVKFYVDDTIYDYQLVSIGKDADVPAVPLKPGHKFIGWDQDFTNVKTNLKINAIFEKLDYENFLIQESKYLKENFSEFVKGGVLPVLGYHGCTIDWFSNSLALIIDDMGKINIMGQDDEILITARIEYFDCVDYLVFGFSSIV